MFRINARRAVLFAISFASIAALPGCGETGLLYIVFGQPLQGSGTQSSSKLAAAGYYKLFDAHDAAGQWLDPDSPFVSIVGSEHLPSSDLLNTAGGPLYILVDSDGRFIHGIRYSANENTLNFDTIEGNPAFGAKLESDGECHVRWSSQGQNADPGGFTTMTYLTTICGRTPDPSNVMAAQVTQRLTFQAIQNLLTPEGAPFIAAGDSAAYEATEQYTLILSESPFTLYPNAAFKTETNSQDQGNGQ